MRVVRRQGLVAALVGTLLVATAGAAAIASCSSPGQDAGPTETGTAEPTTPAATPTAVPEANDGLSIPVADPIYPELGNPALDVLSYQLNLIWSPRIGGLSGTATLTIRTVTEVDRLTLDFAESLTVDSVTVDGERAPALQREDDLVVSLARPIKQSGRVTLVVRYHGKPRAVDMPSNRLDFREGIGLRMVGDGEAWTMQEPYGAFTWYPVNDQPSDEAVYDIWVTVPKGWAAVAHGELMGVEYADDGATYHWSSFDPVASYAATLALGRYTMVTDTGPHGIPITYWLRTDRDAVFLPKLQRVPALLTWLEQHFGRYPFPTAGVVLVDSDSAMETQQMITYGVRRGQAKGEPVDLDIVEETLLHELAHQWFGNSVTPTDWSGMWLNEGFAMYAQWLWSVDRGLRSDASWLQWARGTDAVVRAVAGPPGHPKADHFGESNVYAGPALLLRELHRSLGDAAFFALARGWVQTQRNQQVDRAEFVTFVNHHTGRDFTALINRWLDSPTTPPSSP